MQYLEDFVEDKMQYLEDFVEDFVYDRTFD